MPQLDPTWFASQLFWLAITFIALYVILSRLVLPPLQEIIARRINTVDGDIATAQTMKSEAELARADYERALAKARDRAQTLMAEAMGSFKTSSERDSKEMDRQIEAQLVEATRRIAAKKEEIMDALAPTVDELTSMIFDKLMHSGAGEDTQPAKTLAKGRR